MCLGRREGRAGFGPVASVILKDVPRGFRAAPALFKVRCFSSLHVQKITTPWLPWEKVVIRRIFHFITLLRCRPKWEMRDISLSTVSGSLKRREVAISGTPAGTIPLWI